MPSIEPSKRPSAGPSFFDSFSEAEIDARGNVNSGFGSPSGQPTQYPSAEPSQLPSAIPSSAPIIQIAAPVAEPKETPAPVLAIDPQKIIVLTRALEEGSENIMGERCGDITPDCTKDWFDGYTTVYCSEELPCFITADCKCSNDPCDSCPSGSMCQNDPALSDYDPSRPTMCVDVECGSCSHDGTSCCRRFGDRAMPNALNLGSDGNAQCQLQNNYFAAYGGDLSENLCNGADLYLSTVPAGCGCIPSPTEECRYDRTQQTGESKCFICDADDLIAGNAQCDECQECLSTCNRCAESVSMFDPSVERDECCVAGVDDDCEAGSSLDTKTNAYCCFEFMDTNDSSCRASCAKKCSKKGPITTSSSIASVV